VKRVESDLPGVCILEPVVHGDARGFFLEHYNARVFAKLGIPHVFVQDNHSRSGKGVLRGLHFQLGQPQAKLVRVIRGEVFDVAVDVRVGSPTFGKWTGVTLSEENKRLFFIPEGFAHGFYVLSESADFMYKCSDFYSPTEDRGILWSDPDINIAWPLDGTKPVVSKKDSEQPLLSKFSESDLPNYDQLA